MRLPTHRTAAIEREKKRWSNGEGERMFGGAVMGRGMGRRNGNEEGEREGEGESESEGVRSGVVQTTHDPNTGETDGSREERESKSVRS